MSRTTKVLLVTAFVLLIMALLFGCARLFWNEEAQSGWYIRLNVGYPGAKAIGVGEYDVTGLSIAVYDPGDQLLDAIEWDAVEGPKSYTVQVSQAGTHRIEVTHISDDGGEVVEAMESAEFEIEPMVITVIDITPGMAGLIRIDGESTEPVHLTDYWDAYLTPTGGETADAHLLYIEQTGSFLNSLGMSGTVDGTEVTMSMDDGSATFNGTLISADTIHGDFDWMGQVGVFDLVRSDLLFGLFELSGLVSLSTDQGLGYEGDNEIEYRLEFNLQAGALEGSLIFVNFSGLTTDSYSVISREGPSPGPSEIIGWFNDAWFNEHSVEYGTLDLTRYDATGASGSFFMQFEEGNFLNGTFDCNVPMYGGGVVTINDGFWDGAPVMPETATDMFWSTSTENRWARSDVQYVDADREVWLSFEPGPVPLDVGLFMVPDQIWVHVSDQTDPDSYFEDEAIAGTLVITSYQEDIGMTGYFNDMVFTTGNLSGSFAVSFQTTEYE